MFLKKKSNELRKTIRRMSKKKEIISLIISFVGAVAGLYSVVSFNRFVLMSLPIGIRMVCMILTYWLIALIPTIVMIVNKGKLTDYGFSKEKIGMQIIVGILIGTEMSVLLTLIPHLIGFGEFVDSGKRYKYLWQFIYEFFYCIFAIDLVEEFVFRGFIFEKIKRVAGKDIIAVIISSVFFGVFHFFSGNLVQMVMTACIGAFFCFCRLKIKNCSTLSLIIGHGVYDALITVFASAFL